MIITAVSGAAVLAPRAEEPEESETQEFLVHIICTFAIVNVSYLD